MSSLEDFTRGLEDYRNGAFAAAAAFDRVLAVFDESVEHDGPFTHSSHPRELCEGRSILCGCGAESGADGARTPVHGPPGPITETGGFINQFYGDGIMAMFASADDALRAARDMQAAVDALSDELEHEGRERLRVGIGLHTGALMLGTIGGSTRLDTGVIGDAVNLAARVEGMTKHYGCRVLLSDATRDALTDDAFHLREIDTNRAVGRDEALVVLQLVDAEPQDTRDKLMSSLEDFTRGLADYRSGAFAAAAAAFDRVLAVFDDGAARTLAECSRQLAAETPDGWDGVTVLRSK